MSYLSFDIFMINFVIYSLIVGFLLKDYFLKVFRVVTFISFLTLSGFPPFPVFFLKYFVVYYFLNGGLDIDFYVLMLFITLLILSSLVIYMYVQFAFSGFIGKISCFFYI